MALAVDFTGQAALIAGSTAPSGRVKDIGGFTPVDGNWRAGVWRNRLDTTLTGGTNTSTDKYYMFNVPVGFWVLRTWIVTIVAETTGVTGTFAMGDSDTAAGYLTAQIPSATVGGIVSELYTATGAYTIIMGRYYAVANNIFVQVATALFVNGVYDIFAYVVDCRLPIASAALSAYGSAGGYGEPTP